MDRRPKKFGVKPEKKSSTGSKNAHLQREYEAHKDCSPEELTEYLRTLTPHEREKYQEYAAMKEREQRKKEQAQKEEAKNRLGCIVAVVVFIIFVGIMAYFQDNDTTESSAPSTHEAQETSDAQPPATATVIGNDTSAGHNEKSGNDKAKETKQAKEIKQKAVSQWSATTEKQIESVENNWQVLWRGTLEALKKDRTEKNKARQRVEDFEKKLAESKQTLEKTQIPQNLTKEEQEKLKEANSGYFQWLDERKDACTEIKEIIDKDLTPEKLQEIEAAIQKSNSKMKTIQSRISEFQKGFGLISD